MSNEFFTFSAFLIIILGILLVDLLVIGRRSHEVSFRESLVWSGIWISLALLFSLYLYYFGETLHGIRNMEDLARISSEYAPSLRINPEDFDRSLEIYRKHIVITYLTGYLIEESLSVDNLFVIMTILHSFSVRKADYKKVLFWGILGAIVMRFIFIFAGSALIHRFEWVLYIFGLYLLYTGISMYLKRNKEKQIQPNDHWLVKFLSRRVRIFPRYVAGRFFIKKGNAVFLTPLMVVLLIIEFSDLIFALDSIPAIFGITRDPFIVFFSNVFAILGLRSLFFLLVNVVDKFYLLKVGISGLLVFIGLKMILNDYLISLGYKPFYSLIVILFILTSSIVLSVIFPKKMEVVKN